jgi:GntR family transcriptional repressor for pyruvate dehydrogenase complex
MPFFKPIARDTTLAEQVSRQIHALIVDGQLMPGDRLPSERDLAERFGVSRTAVRDAVKGLAARGMLEVNIGRAGTVVRSPSAANMGEMMTLFLRGDAPALDMNDLIEARRVLEVAIAGFAAERRNNDDLSAMRRNLDDTLKVGKNREKFVQCDIAFHMALARATGNRLFLLLLESVNEPMTEARLLAFRRHGAPERSYHYHKCILDQVADRNAAGAREAMREHLVEAEDTLRKTLKQM